MYVKNCKNILYVICRYLYVMNYKYCVRRLRVRESAFNRVGGPSGSWRLGEKDVPTFKFKFKLAFESPFLPTVLLYTNIYPSTCKWARSMYVLTMITSFNWQAWSCRVFRTFFRKGGSVVDIRWTGMATTALHTYSTSHRPSLAQLKELPGHLLTLLYCALRNICFSGYG